MSIMTESKLHFISIIVVQVILVPCISTIHLLWIRGSQVQQPIPRIDNCFASHFGSLYFHYNRHSKDYHTMNIYVCTIGYVGCCIEKYSVFRDALSHLIFGASFLPLKQWPLFVSNT
jgi:hypothetical protein